MGLNKCQFIMKHVALLLIDEKLHIIYIDANMLCNALHSLL